MCAFSLPKIIKAQRLPLLLFPWSVPQINTLCSIFSVKNCTLQYIPVLCVEAQLIIIGELSKKTSSPVLLKLLRDSVNMLKLMSSRLTQQVDLFVGLEGFSVLFDYFAHNSGDG